MSVFRSKETHTNGSHIPGETPHMKGVGMLVVSLRGVNSGFWSHLGCSEQNAIIFGGDEWSLRAFASMRALRFFFEHEQR